MNIVVFILFVTFSLVELCVIFGLSIVGFLGSCFMWIMGFFEWLGRLAGKK